MQLSLVVLRGTQEGKEIPVYHPQFCIGRDESCHLWTENMTVSRRHATLVVHKDRVLVRDLGSRNGTFVNEVPVAGECEVRHNDRLRIGPLEFRIQVWPTLGASSAPADADPEENTARIRPLPADLEAASSLASSAGPPAWPYAGGSELLKQYLRRTHL